jgi:hypothetical protein
MHNTKPPTIYPRAAKKPPKTSQIRLPIKFMMLRV